MTYLLLLALLAPPSMRVPDATPEWSPVETLPDPDLGPGRDEWCPDDDDEDDEEEDEDDDTGDDDDDGWGENPGDWFDSTSGGFDWRTQPHPGI